MSWLFYLCPLIPMAVFFLFVTLGSSAYAERKPEGYDFSTYKCLNEMYAIDINNVYCGYEILEGTDPSTFKVLNGSTTILFRGQTQRLLLVSHEVIVNKGRYFHKLS